MLYLALAEIVVCNVSYVFILELYLQCTDSPKSAKRYKVAFKRKTYNIPFYVFVSFVFFQNVCVF